MRTRTRKPRGTWPGGKRGLANVMPLSRECAALTVGTTTMFIPPPLRSLVLTPVLTLAAVFGVHSAPQDYAFKLISSELHPGEAVNISVTLTNLRTNSPVSRI